MMRMSWLRWVTLVIVGVVWVASACTSSPMAPTVTPESSATDEPTPSDVEGAAGDGAEAATPEATAPLPSGPYPPTIVDYGPRPGSEVTTNVSLFWRFDQPMDRESFAAALHLWPEVEGDLRWSGDRVVTFQPKALASATRYSVAVDETARSQAGLPLSTELAFTFSTLTPLSVTQTSPAHELTDLRTDAPLRITFNRAVVPLNCSGQPTTDEGDCAALPLEIVPKTKGEGHWVNSSVYEFRPTPGWRAGESYEVVLHAGVTSVDGAELASAYAWAFETAVPRVVDVEPQQGATAVPLDAVVLVRFNTPMDIPTTGGAFRLMAEDGAPVPGTIFWRDNGASLVFTPTEQLDLGTTYTARVATGARAVTSAPLENPQALSFTTVPEPAWVSTAPAAGERGVGVHQPVRLHLTGAMDEQALRDGVTVSALQDGASLYTYYDPSSGVYTLSWQRSPQTEYCVTVSPDIADIYGNRVTEGDEFCFTTGDLPPALELASDASAVTLSAERPAAVYFLAQNARRVSFTLSEVDASTLMKHTNRSGTIVRAWSETFDVEPNSTEVVTVSLERRGGPLPTGLYQLTWEIPGQMGSVQRTDIAVIARHIMVKLASEEALAWVTDLESGVPISRTAVQLVDQEGFLIAGATTDDNGLARFPINPLTDLRQQVAMVTGEPGDDAYGIVLTSWQGEAAPWAFGLTTDTGPQVPYRLFMHTDRPLYRPTQALRYQGVLREDHDLQYAVPEAGTQLTVTLREPGWTPIVTETVTVDEMGAFEGDIFLPEDLRTGEHMLEATMALPGLGHPVVLGAQEIRVDAYRKPGFEVRVVPEFEAVTQGETIRWLVEAAYFAGGAVSDAEIAWVLRAAPYNYAEDLLSGAAAHAWTWSGSSPWDGEALVADGAATLDDRGQYVIEVPADLVPLGPQDAVASQRWTVEARVVDEAGLPVHGRGDTIVHKADYYVGLRPDTWVVRAKQDVEVDVRVSGRSGEGVSGQEVEVVLVRRHWHLRSVDATWAYTDTVEFEQNVTTGSTGMASVEVEPSLSGPYVVIATVDDPAGHESRSEMTLWVGGASPAAWRAAEGRIELIADARAYEVGDVAEILVPVNYEEPYQVLLTVERGDLLTVERYDLEAPNALIEIPIEPTYVPNVYISCVVVRPGSETAAPDVRIGYLEIKVDPGERLLDVEVVADAESYEPRGEARLSIRVTDHEGRPVAADLSVSAVDQAVLALEERRTALISEVFYGTRPLRVLTGDGLLVLMNRLGDQLTALEARADHLLGTRAPMGMGGGADASEAALPVRTNFVDTALWRTQLRTDDAGEAEVVFELPDSLTTWNVHAYAITTETHVGEGKTSLRVSKPLYVRPVTPRFFTVGDEVELAAVVHNNTDEDLTVDVWLAAEQGVELVGPREQEVALSAGTRRRITWQVTVPEGQARYAQLAFGARSGDYEDVTRPTVAELAGLPIYRYTSPDVVRTAGVLEDAVSRLEAIIVPSESTEGTRLRIDVTPSLATPWLDADVASRSSDVAPSLNSTDAWVSRLLLAVTEYRALVTAGAEPAELERLQVTIGDALDRLYARQNPDGGWSWWHGVSHVHLTSYAAFGILRAGDAGFPVRSEALERALAYMGRMIGRGIEADLRYPHFALGLYVMAEAGTSWPQGAASQLYAGREALGVVGRAYLAMALWDVDPSDTRIATLLSDLRGSADVSASGVHWEEMDAEHWTTPRKATAVTVHALTHAAPDDELLAQAVRWLMVTRDAERTSSSYETAWVRTALADYVAATGETAPNYRWGLAVNGVPVREEVQVELPAEHSSFTFTPEDGADTATESLSLRPGLNLLELSRGSGSGALYYTAQLDVALPLSEVEAEQRGLRLVREYCRSDTPAQAPEARACAPVTAVQVGDLVDVRLTLTVPKARYFVQLEDRLPSGLEFVETPDSMRFLRGPKGPMGGVGAGGAEPGPLPTAGLFNQQRQTDDRVQWYARELPPGTYVVSYQLRAIVPGTYRALPAMIAETYVPEVWGRSAPATLIVGPGPGPD